MSASGARQWKVDCQCARRRGVADDRDWGKLKRMHSQVSAANLSYFVEEGRVGEGVSESDLRRIHRDLADDEALVVCNVCGSIRVVSK